MNKTVLFSKLKKEGYSFVEEPSMLFDEVTDYNGRAVRYKGDSSILKNHTEFTKARTHNIQLEDNKIWWENNNSKDFIAIFDSSEEAKNLFEEITGIKAHKGAELMHI